MEAIEIQKYLMKSKTMAQFDRFENNSLYYNVEVLGATYQFPVPVIKESRINMEVSDTDGELTGITVNAWISKPTTDVKGAAFTTSMRGSELYRWIKKAYNNNEFIKISA